jgi:hypothetical protein
VTLLFRFLITFLEFKLRLFRKKLILATFYYKKPFIHITTQLH